MNFQDLKAAKEVYDKVAELCDTMENVGLWKQPKSSNFHLRDVLQRDVAQFIMYLSASDGRISAEEVQAYRVITGFGGDDISSIVNHIKENNIYSMDFESEPPFIMRLISEAERKAVYAGVKLESSSLNILVNLYDLIGKIIVSIDGGITYTEKRDLNIIMNTIRGFADDHDVVGNKWSLLN